MKTTLQRLQIIIFIGFLLSVPLYWLSQDGNFNTTSVIEGRILSSFPKMGYSEVKRTIWLAVRGRFADAKDVFISRLEDQTIQDQFASAASDQFPLRISLIRMVKAADRAMIASTYSLLPDKALPADSKTQIYVTRDRSTVIKGLLFFNDETKRELDARIKVLSDLAAEFPDKHIYVFYFEKLAYSKFDPRLPNFVGLDGGQSFEYFAANLPQDITLGKMELTSVNDYNDYFYHTDHHWNIRGAWKAYQEMYTMVCVNYPGISPANDTIQYITYPDLEFLGTYARDTMYPFKPEKFEIARVDLPYYYILERDYKILYNKSTEYNAGIFDKDPYVSHYAEYFGTNKKFLTYHFDNGATKNLLLIGTSYKIPLQPWIASHYFESYFVNPLEYPNFSLARFMRDHNVDDIIILTDMDELLDPAAAIEP
jgi:hypothetical protein